MTTIRRSSGSIFWGLLLVAAGGLLLARNLGYAIPIWSYIARYWPAILIAWGMLKLIDYFRFRRAGDTRPLFSGGEVFLLIFIILAGSAVTTAGHLSSEIGHIFEIGDLNDLWDITGNNYSFDERHELDVPPGSTIQILNLYGDVDIRPSDSDRITLDVSKTVRAFNREEADRLSADFTFDIKNEGSSYRIVSNRDDFDAGRNVGGQRQRFKSSLTISVPAQSALQIENRNGRVTLQNLSGNQTITNRYGSVEVRGIKGGLQIENRNGSVTVEGVTEAVVVQNSYAATSARDIGGNLEIRNRNGAVDVIGVKGNATISNSYAPISVENVQGEVIVSGRNNGLDLSRIGGDLRAESSYQNVAISDARGAVTVNSRNGDLSLTFERPPEKDISISSRFGTVRIELPSSSSFTVDARTEFGQVSTEFDGVDRSSSGREASLRGRVGVGGPQITITTRNGDIRLDRRG